MEVIIPNHNFDFNSARSSPHVSPPSTPKAFGNYYFSAPTSPSRLSQVLYNANFIDDPDSIDDDDTAAKKNYRGFDFAFDVASDDWENSSVSAEDLFHGGVIKPLNRTTDLDDSKSARKVSPLQPLTDSGRSQDRGGRDQRQQQRQPSQRSRTARSLSPTRKSPSQGSTVCSVLTSVKSGGNKKWSFKDLFLFRSASEGRASDKDPLKKYTEAVLRPAGSMRRGSVPVSAHERHYTVNRAVSEDMKKKTFLPYKQGILGRLAFNPAVHALANGFGFSRK